MLKQNEHHVAVHRSGSIACAVFAVFLSHVEVANNLPFAKFYNACIQTRCVHSFCDNGRGSVWSFKYEEKKTYDNVLPTLRNLEITL